MIIGLDGEEEEIGTDEEVVTDRLVDIDKKDAVLFAPLGGMKKKNDRRKYIDSKKACSHLSLLPGLFKKNYLHIAL